MPVATTFSHADENGKELLGEVARLDTMVTMVDCLNFLQDWNSSEKAKERKELGAEEDDEREIVDLLTDQLECANVVLLNKSDLVDKVDLEFLRSLVTRLNPIATIVDTKYSKVDLEKILNTGKFNMQEAEDMPGWHQELSGQQHIPETEEYGIGSFIYRSNRPFHQQRLDEALDGPAGWMRGLPGILRSKGLIWVAGLDNGTVWSQAGTSMSLSGHRPWLTGNVNCQNIQRPKLLPFCILMHAASVRALFASSLSNRLKGCNRRSAPNPFWHNIFRFRRL